MNTDIHSKPPLNQPTEAAKEIARQAADAAKDATQRASAAAKDALGNAKDATKDAARDTAEAAKDIYNTMSSKVEDGVARTKEYALHAVDATKEAAHRATDAAKDLYQTAATKAEESLEQSKEYVRQNPVPVVLGALVLGVALGYLLVTARREPTFRERYVDDPLHSARDAIYAALAPVGERLHESYDSARNGAGKAMDKISRSSSRTADSWADQLGRVGSNLKFW